MPVYMIQAGGPRGPVKIGHGDPEERRRILQTGNHLELVLLRVWVGDESHEHALHARFADLEIRGEWFSFSRAMLGDMGLVEIIEPPLEVVKNSLIPAATVDLDAGEIGQRLLALRKSQGMTQSELAAAVNVSRPTIAMIETGKDLPGRDLILRLSRFFGVPFIEATLPTDPIEGLSALMKPADAEAL